EVGRVLWRSGGNPLFVTELARWEVEGDDAGAAVPQAIREVVRQRLARLPPGTVGELRTVAVIGESFEVATALAATPSDRITCLDALGAAIDAHILRPDGTGYQFAHAIVRE